MTANNSLFLYLDQVMKSNMARFCSSHSSSPEGVPKDAPETAEVTRKRYLQMIYRSESIPLWDRRQTALSGYNAFAVTFSEWGHGGRESQLGGVNPDHSPTHKRARGVVKWSIAAVGAAIASVLGKENARKSPSK